MARTQPRASSSSGHRYKTDVPSPKGISFGKTSFHWLEVPARLAAEPSPAQAPLHPPPLQRGQLACRALSLPSQELLRGPAPAAAFCANTCFPGESEFIREMGSRGPRLPTAPGASGEARPAGRPPKLAGWAGDGEKGRPVELSF